MTDVQASSLENLKLAGANLSYCNLNKTILHNVELTGAVFLHSNLQDTVFDTCDLKNAVMTGTDLRTTRIVNSNTEGIDANHVDLPFITH